MHNELTETGKHMESHTGGQVNRDQVEPMTAEMQGLDHKSKWERQTPYMLYGPYFSGGAAHFPLTLHLIPTGAFPTALISRQSAGYFHRSAMQAGC